MASKKQVSGAQPKNRMPAMIRDIYADVPEELRSYYETAAAIAKNIEFVDASSPSVSVLVAGQTIRRRHVPRRQTIFPSNPVRSSEQGMPLLTIEVRVSEDGGRWMLGDAARVRLTLALPRGEEVPVIQRIQFEESRIGREGQRCLWVGEDVKTILRLALETS